MVYEMSISQVEEWLDQYAENMPDKIRNKIITRCGFWAVYMVSILTSVIYDMYSR